MNWQRSSGAPRISERENVKIAQWRQQRLGMGRMSLAPALRGWLTGIILR
jgi:hypothetical protein